jgi:TonB family protein
VTRQSPVFAAIVIAAAVAAARVVAGQADPLAARLQNGGVPIVPVQTVGAGQVLLSVNVSERGAVGAIDVLRSTPPFTTAVVAAVRGWRFVPAQDALRRPMPSRVLVGAMFGAPTLNVPTLGEPPKDLTPAATALPIPLTMPMPAYPQNARSAGTVMIETLVAPSGRVVGVTLLRSSPPFDDPSMESARGWSFRPPQGAGLPANTYAYLIFAFQVPVVGPASRP